MVVPTNGARASFNTIKKCPTNISIICTAQSGYDADSSDSSDSSIHLKSDDDVSEHSDDPVSSGIDESKHGNDMIINESCIDRVRQEIQKMNHNDVQFRDIGSAQCRSNKLSNTQQTSFDPSVSLYSDVNYKMQSEDISNQLNQNHRPSPDHGRRSRCRERNTHRQRSSSTEKNSGESADEREDCCRHAKHVVIPLLSSNPNHSRRFRPSALRNPKSGLSSKVDNRGYSKRSSSEPRRLNSQSKVDILNDYTQRNAESSRLVHDSCRGCCENSRKYSEPRWKPSGEKSFRLGNDDQQNNLRCRGSNTHCTNPGQIGNPDYQWHLIIRRTDEHGKVKCLLNRKLPINSTVSWPSRVLNYVNRYCPNETLNEEHKIRASSPSKEMNPSGYRAESASARKEQQFSHQNSNHAGTLVGESHKKKHLPKLRRSKSCLKFNPEDEDDKRNLRLKDSYVHSKKHYPHNRVSRQNDDDSDLEVIYDYLNQDISSRHYDDDDESVSTAPVSKGPRSEKNKCRKVRDFDSKYNSGKSKTDDKKRYKSSGMSQKDTTQRHLSVAADDSVSCSSSWSDALYMDQKASGSDYGDHHLCRLPSKGYAGDGCSSDSDGEHISKHNSCIQTSPPRSRRDRRKVNKKCQVVNEKYPTSQRDRRVTIDPQPSYCNYTQHKNQHNCLSRSNSACHRRRRNVEKRVSLSPFLPPGERLKTLPIVTNATEELLNEIESIIHRDNI